MATAPEEHSAAQWAAIVSLLRAQIGSGLLPTVAYVGASIDLYTNQTPAIGVQLQRLKCEQYSTQKVKVECDFLVLVAVRSNQVVNGSVITPPNLDDAMTRAQAIVADGSGNGVANILRNKANQSLGGLASHVFVAGVDYSWEIGRGASGSDEVWAYALVSVEVKDYISTS